MSSSLTVFGRVAVWLTQYSSLALRSVVAYYATRDIIAHVQPPTPPLDVPVLCRQWGYDTALPLSTWHASWANAQSRAEGLCKVCNTDPTYAAYASAAERHAAHVKSCRATLCHVG